MQKYYLKISKNHDRGLQKVNNRGVQKVNNYES
jgi:hypothetical protein